MRGILVIVPLLLVALWTPTAVGHDAARCEPPFVFPTLALWYVPAGGGSSFYLPAGTFGSFFAATPLEVSQFVYGSCEPDPTCHQHAWVGPGACGAARSSVIEFRNEGVERAPVFLAVGQCLQRDVCNAL